MILIPTPDEMGRALTDIERVLERCNSGEQSMLSALDDIRDLADFTDYGPALPKLDAAVAPAR